MGKLIIGILARAAGAWRTVAIRYLQDQLAGSRAEAKRFENNYLVLADDHADLRAAYERLAFERLHAWGLDREEHAGGDEHREVVKGLTAHRRRSAPIAGDRSQ